MSGGKLTVGIGGDITDLQNKIKEAEFNLKELSKFKLERIKLGLDTTEINGNIKSVKQSLTDLRSTLKDTGNAIGKDFKTGTVNGGNALLQFSRIAQDAPFGIIGIGNNITATAEAFGNLKNSTGSTGGALKALASSLMGTGGILLGVSLLTTGLTLMAQSGLTVSDVFDKLTGNFDASAKEMAKLRSEATKSAGQEISEVKAYVSVAKDRNLSDEKRLIAVDELQKKYPAYFGNLTKEQILNGNVANAVNDVTIALRNKALAQAYAGKAGELASKEVELRDKEAELILKSKDALKQLNKEKKDGADIDRSALILKAYQLQLKDVQKEILSTISDIDKYQKKQNEFAKKSILLGAPEIKKDKDKKVFNTPQVSTVNAGLISAPLFDTLSIKTFNGQIDAFGNKIKALPNIIEAEMLKASQKANEGAILMAVALADFNNKASEIISGSIVETFAGLGNAIGNALATGGNILEAVGKSLLSSLGGVLTEMGKMAIQVGVGLLAIKVALKSLNPAVAIGAGVALIALGSFFSAKSSSLSGSIGGGASSASGSGANNSSFTSSGFGSSNQGGGTVVFEISGQKLIGVLSNTINGNKRLGGTIGLG